MYEYISLGILALLCILIGLFPKPFLTVISGIICRGFLPAGSSPESMNINWLMITLIFVAIPVICVLLYLVKDRIQKRYGRRFSPAWGCGYDGCTSRMQYTASSFADELNSIAKGILLYRKNITWSNVGRSGHDSFSSHSEDFVDSTIIIAGCNKIQHFFSRSNFLNFTDIRYYIAFILIIISFYSLLAFIWI